MKSNGSLLFLPEKRLDYSVISDVKGNNTETVVYLEEKTGFPVNDQTQRQETGKSMIRRWLKIPMLAARNFPEHPLLPGGCKESACVT